jgi:predicted AlkP superfamily pyrophosphatase or phosphodiesterase
MFRKEKDMKKKVLLIGLDGVRPDAIFAAKTPNIGKLAVRGVSSWNAQTERLCYSSTCWTSLLTGVHGEKHNVLLRYWEVPGPERDLQYKSISGLLTDWNPQVRCIAHSGWPYIITEIFEEGTLSNSSSGSDKEITKRMCQDINKDKGDFYFIQLNETDEAGHEFDFSARSAGYLKAIEKADGYVGRLLDALYFRPHAEDWLVCLVSDHGGLGDHHCLVEVKRAEELTIPIIIAGNSEGELKLDELIDVIPIISKFFGMPPKEYWAGIN